jgi:hypothetical protein
VPQNDPFVLLTAYLWAGKIRRGEIILENQQEKAMLDKTKAKDKVEKPTSTNVVIAPLNFQSSKIRIEGASPYVMNAFSSGNRDKMIANQEAGSRSKKGAKREPKDFNAIYEGAKHYSREGWLGIPASGLRSAMISACKVAGFHMSKGKLCVFVEPDGFDKNTGEPLVRIYGEPTRRDLHVKLANGSSDVLARPFFDKWHAEPTVTWDADMFSAQDVVNLLVRAGRQVGIGAGRHDSKMSTGMGWGCFTVKAT